MEISCRLLNNGVPVTGGSAATALTIRRVSNGYLYDWNDATFKASGWTAPTATMTETDAVNLPGHYNKSVSEALWVDGWYQYLVTYSGVSPSLYAEGDQYVYDGKEFQPAVDTQIAAVPDTVWDELLTGATHNIATSAGRRLRQIAENIITDGIAQGAGTGNNQIQLATDASSMDGAYDPACVSIVAGTGAGQVRAILQYAGSTRTATVNRDWKVTPDATSEYIITPFVDIYSVNEGLIRAATSNTVQLNALASTHDGAYVGQAVFIVSGTGQDQAGLVTAYIGSTQTATIDSTWAVTPDTTSAYVIIPRSPVLLDSVTTAQIDALESKVDIIDGNVDDVETLLNTVDGKIDIIDTNVDAILAVVIPGSGLYEITVTVYQTSTTTGIPSATVAAYFGTDLMARQVTDENGQCVLHLDAGTYDIRLSKVGVIFATDETIIVSAEALETIYGTPVSIPLPESSESCVLYDYCYDQASQEPLASVTASAKITTLPADFYGKLHHRLAYDGTYDALTGLWYVEIVRGATVTVTILETGVNNTVTIPDAATARLADLL